jgi:hypothetical protein
MPKIALDRMGSGLAGRTTSELSGCRCNSAIGSDDDVVEFSVLCVLLRAKESPDNVIQSMRRKVLGEGFAPSIAVRISGQNPSYAQKKQATPNQVLLLA